MDIGSCCPRKGPEPRADFFPRWHSRSDSRSRRLLGQRSTLRLAFNLKLLPGSRLSPWAAVGGGYALYQQSAQLSNGQNSPNKFLNRDVFDYDDGLDYRLFRFIGLRGEVRDFFSGNLNLNTALNSSTQHNVVASGGIILRF